MGVIQSAIDTASYNGNSPSASVAVTINGVTAGSSLLAFVTWNGSAVSCTGVSDGGAYTLGQSVYSSFTEQNSRIALLEAASSGSHTVVASFSANASYRAIRVIEIDGVGALDAWTGINTASPSTATDALTSGSVTSTDNNAIVVGLAINVDTSVAPSAGTAFTSHYSDAVTGDRIESRTQATAGSTSALFTAADTSPHQAFVVVFRALAAGQSARPDADVTDGAWTPSTGTDNYACIDEATANDADYISVSSNSAVRMGLSALNTPQSGTRTLRYRTSGSVAKKLVARLIEGSNTVVQSWTVDPLPSAVTQYNQTVTGSISNYGDLDVEFETADATSPPSPSVSFGAIGTGASGGTTVTPSYPSGITAGQYLTCHVSSGATNSEIPTTPSGWTLLATEASTDGTFGVDTGPRRHTVFGKVADGTESGTLTVSITNGNTCRGSIIRWTKSQGSYQWSVVGQGANDSTSGTGFSATTAAIDWAVGDACAVGVGQRVDSATQSAQSLTASGITFGARTNRESTAVTTGNDHRHVIDTFAAVSSGSGSVATTWAYTASAAVSGGCVVVRLREIPPTEFARVTWAALEVPAGSASSDVAAAALAQAAATATLSTSIRLNAAALAVSTASGGLIVPINLSASAAALAASSGALTTSIRISAAALAQAAATAGLNAQSLLASIAIANAAGSASLLTSIRLDADSQAASLASAQLVTAIRLDGDALAQALAGGAITTSIRLAADASATAGGTAALGGSSALSANAMATASASAQALTSIRMQAAAFANALASGTLYGPITFSANAQAQAAASAALGTQIRLLASGAAQASSSAALDTGILLAAQSVSTSAAGGSLSTVIRLQANAAAASAASAALLMQSDLAATATGSSAASASLITQIRMSAAALATAASGGALVTRIDLGAAAAAAPGATASLQALPAIIVLNPRFVAVQRDRALRCTQAARTFRRAQRNRDFRAVA